MICLWRILVEVADERGHLGGFLRFVECAHVKRFAAVVAIETGTAGIVDARPQGRCAVVGRQISTVQERGVTPVVTRLERDEKHLANRALNLEHW